MFNFTFRKSLLLIALALLGSSVAQTPARASDTALISTANLFQQIDRGIQGYIAFNATVHAVWIRTQSNLGTYTIYAVGKDGTPIVSSNFQERNGGIAGSLTSVLPLSDPRVQSMVQSLKAKYPTVHFLY